MSAREKRGTAAVVGGRGFIGGACVEALRDTGWDVVVVTHNAPLAARHDGYRWGDMLDPTTLGPAVEGVDVVVQSANFPDYPFEKPRQRHDFLEYDGLGTERLVRAARAAGVRRYVYVAGVGVTENPVKPYFQAIRRGELAVEGSGMEHVTVRPAFVYGPRDNGINRIVRACRYLPVLPLPGAGRQNHQPVHVDDVGSLVARASEPGAPEGTFEIGGPDRMTMRSMLSTALEMVGRGRPVVDVSDRVARPTARMLAALPGSLLTPNALDFMREDFLADLEPLQKHYETRLTPFLEGLRGYLTR
ncbi:NAD-dependent epimerase/dehydratase family protein [Streptomyces sp. NPDC048172]|uniref:NAD-dependent epimerase/dehydratase family protein n=1 Tax=Streptomyces sp. NPDC048172 TaxID=3365505 RepID=UPI0037190964